jgi:NAD(P)H-dependent FMN reductase
MAAAQPPSRILLVSGSTRGGSTNSALLRTAAAVPPHGVEAELYAGMTDLPHFNPDDDHDPLPAPVAALRKEIAAADALLICTPEYAGTLPGSFKNLLDWTVGGGELYEKPVAWLNVANPGRGGGAAATLTLVLSYVGATVINSACRDIPVPRTAITPEGTVRDPLFASTVAEVWAALLTRLGGAP